MASAQTTSKTSYYPFLIELQGDPKATVSQGQGWWEQWIHLGFFSSFMFLNIPPFKQKSPKDPVYSALSIDKDSCPLFVSML